jgi:DNA gyrase subunit B
LLLTFFFRQMSRLIEAGRIYCALPPLFRIQRGKKVEYVQSVETMNDTFLKLGLDGTRLEVAGRTAFVEGDDLLNLLKPLIRLEKLRAGLKRKGIPFDEYLKEEEDGQFPEWHVMAYGEERYFFEEGDAEKFRDEKQTEALARLALAESESEKKPKAAEVDAGDQASEEVDAESLGDNGGNGGHATLAAAGLGIEMRKLTEAQGLTEVFSELASMGFSRADYLGTSIVEAGYKFKLVSEKNEVNATSLASVLDQIRELGKKGMDVQRYKGLGEMNAEQLLETTMDPANRVLLRVRLEDAVAADDMFKILMGEGVAARKEFIEQHALEITDLDV